jgi:hypothetical protein
MEFIDQTFDGQRIVLDFNSFENCTFRGCSIVFMGYGPVGLTGCTFEGCAFPVDGPPARYMLFLRELYRLGESSQAAIEGYFEIIRGNADPFMEPLVRDDA